ncbi:MAG TPA: hypothetical protein DEF85_05855 [Clostridiaceae bacterium]|nr:hypothetical protein [Clostridiaceae bacterium]HBF77606.1 hypothetical protein [Clostridiaceae bacterium]HBG38714.1 hypothetical protein [Clostridiaceae bacterium]HBN29103.1 hypothetical protein [Clostridiaceae bacterium]HBX48399.1 hypothetical protein [Clostridiaceae bacterium]
MVMKNKASNAANYSYGSVAYKIQPEIEENQKKSIKNSNHKNYLKVRANIIFLVGVIFACSIVILYRYSYIIQANGNLGSTKAKIQDLQSENKNLIVEIAKTENIKDVEKYAVAKQGMVEPLPKEIVYMDVKPLSKIAEANGANIKNNEANMKNKVNKFFGLIK